jgi:hypothetical protein
MRIYPVLVVQFVLGCARPNYAERWPDRLTVFAGPQPGYAIKQIVERVPPTTLIADDGSICRASHDRFAAAKQGRWVACEWNLPDSDLTITERHRGLRLEPGLPPELGVLPAPLIVDFTTGQPVG